MFKSTLVCMTPYVAKLSLALVLYLLVSHGPSLLYSPLTVLYFAITWLLYCTVSFIQVLFDQLGARFLPATFQPSLVFFDKESLCLPNIQFAIVSYKNSFYTMVTMLNSVVATFILTVWVFGQDNLGLYESM